MKQVVIALAALVVACDSSTESGDNATGLLDDMSGQEGLCGNVYYSELRGNYDGQIRYFRPDATCLWDVDMQLTTTAVFEPQQCRTAISMTSEILSGDSICADIGIGAPLVEPFNENQLNGERNNVTWPIDALIDVNAQLDTGKVYPVGQSGQVTVFTVQFDGMGNVTFPVSTSTDESFTGVLVKQ
ncbi:MAG: hypothetical protein AB8B97_13300 [Granulosicoccus sp.]